MNKIFLIGNLTRDPELSSTPAGVSVCKFSLAVNRPFVNKAGERETDFLNVTVWRQLGENCAKYLKKGRKACVVGRVETRTYEQDGVKKYATDIIADEVEFLSSPSTDSEGDYGHSPAQGAKKKMSELTPLEDENLPF